MINTWCKHVFDVWVSSTYESWVFIAAPSSSLTPACLCLSANSNSLQHTVNSIPSSVRTFCLSLSLPVLAGCVRVCVCVQERASYKEMNPINQALVPVSSVPGHAPSSAFCGSVHCCPAENLQHDLILPAVNVLSWKSSHM